MSEMTPELVERMVAFAKRCAEKPIVTLYDSSKIIEEARAIVAQLPEPVDPDLIEARRHFLTKQPHDERAIMAGERDHTGSVRSFMEGIKRGRLLATPATSA